MRYFGHLKQSNQSKQGKGFISASTILNSFLDSRTQVDNIFSIREREKERERFWAEQRGLVNAWLIPYSSSSLPPLLLGCAK